MSSAQKEVATGKLADTGLALGARTAQVVNFARDLERLNGIVDSNALVSSRLSATQEALGQLSAAAQDFLSTLTASASGDARLDGHADQRRGHARGADLASSTPASTASISSPASTPT